jgi:hypothetical protein
VGAGPWGWAMSSRFNATDAEYLTRATALAMGVVTATDRTGADEAMRRLAQFSENGMPEAGAEDPAETWPTLRALLDRPELLEPPEEVVPRLAHRSRTTLMVGPDKIGKTQLYAHAATCRTRGRSMFGQPVARGAVVWCGLEEALGDAVRRFSELDADPDRLRVLALRPPSVLAALDEILAAHPADLVVIDSLAEYARVTLGRAPDDGDAAGWGAVIRPVVGMGRQHSTAFALLHHPRRSDGQYRGSGEIAAAVDCLWEMLPPNQGEDPTLRRIRGRARWPVEDWSLRMEDGRYVLGGGGALTLDARILADTAANPGTSRSAQHDRLGGRKQTYLSTVGRLIEAETVRDHKGGLYVPSDLTEELL